MSAVEHLLRRLESVDSAASHLADPNLADPHLLDHLKRGIAVHGLVAVESFLRDRMREWTSVIQAARISPARLPGGTKQYEDRVLEVLPKRIRDSDYTAAAQRSLLLGDIGKSLTSLYSSELVPHYLAFMWAGSNVKAQDIESIVTLVGTPQNEVWTTLTGIWQLVDVNFPRTSIKAVFDSLCELRHSAAHDGAPSLPILNLRSTARNARLLCLCIDVAVTRGLHALVSTSTQGQRQRAPRPPLRKLIKAGPQWAEHGPGSGRAYRRYDTLEEALRNSISRARSGSELLIVLDKDSNILDWRYPII